ncbi:MAG: bifunctional folylpolyglutamate synthase/dihydrofolate synthase [Proteobacteria bacterium]|nr:bifunctional folylpolyglutamate synthase/dihydrofolate synthase [Pseudomonadota bacterium]MBU4294286.1 bifunctional folylpolyglutamate synthase/dihydrofolate synthase [Pseudomonadota bacterium]MCG2749759.1 bifunctional folylpolyglutamate synthase/dihydrofolate synthase [Desulfobulbaceae bacterium]
MQYQEAWSYLDQLQFFKIKLGLDSMAAFLEGVHHPHQGLKFIHVAGTNGKGSVSVTLLALLSEAGYKVGLYTSPHLTSVRERFRINDRFISKDEFAEIATIVRDSLGERQITYFEFTTALALLWFAREKVDIVILEVGLGGRLDATNVITPLVSIITNVSMDHEAHLGTTLAQIAAEKAGIVKNRIPVVAGVATDVSLDVASRTCLEKEAPFYLLGRDFKAVRHGDGTWDYLGAGGRARNNLPLGMKGGHQFDNTAIALAALDLLRQQGFTITEEHIRSALTKVHWPGRLEYFCLDSSSGKTVACPADPLAAGDSNLRRYLLDGAHNPAGIVSLTQSLEADFVYRKLICVWASMADKDIGKTLTVIAPYCHRIIFTRPEAERSATAEKLREILPDSLKERSIAGASVAEALALAAEEAGPEDLICVAGSLYLVGAARKILLGDIVNEH